jgi:hypothetical protein
LMTDEEMDAYLRNPPDPPEDAKWRKGGLAGLLKRAPKLKKTEGALTYADFKRMCDAMVEPPVAEDLRTGAMRPLLDILRERAGE